MYLSGDFACKEKILALFSLFDKMNIVEDLARMILSRMIYIKPHTMRYKHHIHTLGQNDGWRYAGCYLNGCKCCDYIQYYPFTTLSYKACLKTIMNNMDPKLFSIINIYPYEYYFLQKQCVIYYSIYIFAQVNIFDTVDNIKLLFFAKRENQPGQYSFREKHEIIENLKNSLKKRTKFKNLNNIFNAVLNDQYTIFC
jgi:hypothetical protein